MSAQEPLSRPTRTRDSSDYALIAYYLLILLSGVSGIFTIHHYSLDAKPMFWIMTLSSIVIGALGVWVRWLGERRAELIVLSFIALLTVVQAGSLLLTGGEDQLAPALRGLAGPFVILPYALLRQRTVISKRDLSVVSMVVKAALPPPEDTP